MMTISCEMSRINHEISNGMLGKGYTSSTQPTGARVQVSITPTDTWKGDLANQGGVAIKWPSLDNSPEFFYHLSSSGIYEGTTYPRLFICDIGFVAKIKYSTGTVSYYGNNYFLGKYIDDTRTSITLQPAAQQDTWPTDIPLGVTVEVWDRSRGTSSENFELYTTQGGRMAHEGENTVISLAMT